MFNSKELIIYILPILLITFAIINTISFWRKKYLLTFFSGIVVMFSFIFTGFISMMPNIVVFKSGENISILEGAAGVNTLSTLLIALFIFLPIVSIYQGYKYYRFWGKL